MWFVLAAAIGGGVVGAFLPALIRTVPDRQPYPDDPDPDPAPRPHRDIGSIPRLAWYTAPALALVWAAVVFIRSGHPADVAAYLVVTALWVAAAVVDLTDQRLPDLLTLPAAGAGALLLAVAALFTGQWNDLGRAALGVLALGAFYLAFALVAPSQLGMGDVKLALSVGLLLGWIGWPVVIAGTFLAFVAGGVLGIVLLIAGRARWKSAIPFGPSMMLGALLGVGWGRVLADVYLTL